MARKRKPTVLKLFEGRPGHMPLPKDEPIPKGGDIDTPPEWLTPSQRGHWQHAVDYAPAGLLRQLDLDVFTSWVIAVDEFINAEKHLIAEGRVVKLGGGVRTTTNKEGVVTKTVRSDSWIVSPWIKVKANAFQQMIRAASELGFSPTSRARITVPGGGEASKKDANRFSRNKRA